MKKTFAILWVALVALMFSCKKESIEEPENLNEILPEKIIFDLTATHPEESGTKAIKTGWESGDVIFVFFTGKAAPAYLEMRWDGTEWKNTPKGLSLSNGESGTMRAVYLPYGSDLTVQADGSAFRFSETQYSYYLTATRPYKVSGGKVSATFNMSIPEGYVQFYIPASAGDFTLRQDYITPVGVALVQADGSISETSDKAAGEAMTGYAYGEGRQFSGIISADADGQSRHWWFSLKNESTGTQHTLFRPGKSLSKGYAVALPKVDEWVEVGMGKKVFMYRSDRAIYGAAAGGIPFSSANVYWYTCNGGGATFPTEPRSSARPDSNYPFAPSKEMIEDLLNRTDQYHVTLHGVPGVVFDNRQGGHFFLPQAYKPNYWVGSDYEDKVFYVLGPKDSNDVVNDVFVLPDCKVSSELGIDFRYFQGAAGCNIRPYDAVKPS